MFRALVSYIWGDEKKDLEEAYAMIQDREERTVPVAEDGPITEYTCCNRIGFITSSKRNVYVVDNLHTYISDEDSFEIGTKISYDLYKDRNVLKVANVKVISDEWIDAESNESKKWFMRSAIGEVHKREGRIIHIKPNDIRINLNSISSEFIPKVGDWVELEIKAEVDENVTNLFGKILEVTKISPLRTKIVKGMIRSFNDQTFTGHIERDIFFERESLSEGYLPRTGDRIIAEVIESNQGVYNWRALKVILQNSLQKTVNFFELEVPKLIGYQTNIEDIFITDDIVVHTNSFDEINTFHVEIKNQSQEAIQLKDIKFDSKISQIQLHSPDINGGLLIKKDSIAKIEFNASAKTVGKSVEVIIFIFHSYNIGRNVTINLETGMNHAKFKPYRRDVNHINQMRNFRQKSEFQTIRGERINVAPRFVGGRMGEYKIPDNLWTLFLKYDDRGTNNRNIYHDLITARPCVKENLTIKSYEERFHTLLYMEEIECVISMRKYDNDRACFIRNGEYLMLEVENLSEKRPSVIIGDKIIATNPLHPSNHFEGFVHKVTAKHIFLKFSPIMHDSYDGEDYSVNAIQSRVPIRKLHHAVHLAMRNLGKDFLFPSKVVKKEHQVKFTYDKYDDVIKPSDAKKIVDAHQLKPLNGDEGGSRSGNFTHCDDNKVNKKTNIEEIETYSVKEKENVVEAPFVTPVKNSNKEILEAIKLKLANSNTPPSGHKSIMESPNSKKTPPVSNRHASKKRPNKNIGGGDNIVQKPNTTDSQNAIFKLEWYDKSLNYFQKEAVRNILLGEARPLPYIIFGPPGTGKTVTVIESILQIIRMIPDSRILVGAPSNSAADIIAVRLIDSGCFKPGDLVRFVSYKSVLEDSIPLKLVPYSATGSISREGTMSDEPVSMANGLTLGCTLSVIGRHRVTVGTCSALGTLHNMGFIKGHFTHIIVDEAGQCTEPEIMIPLVFLDVKQGQCVLSGDPMQLGPVINSRQASEFGLGDSYLERLLNRFPYVRDVQGFPESGGYDPRLVTCLVYNYRSLPGVIHLSNQLFYHSELRPTLSEIDSDEAIFLDKLKELLPRSSTGVPPLVFHGLDGQNFQSEDSPSWYNPDEASQVFYYVNEFYRLGVKSDEIGIISPYNKQVRQIRQILREANFDIPKIGTVEEFQGHEFHVIILSTVRSNRELINSDVAHSLGFISNPKRLNVALTRAQCLCIVVGNPFLLTHDPYWRTLLIHCRQIKAYVGCELNVN